MNDPELDAPIQDSAREIDEELEGDISRSSSHVSSDSFSPSRHNQSSAFRQELRRADEHDKDHPEGFYQAKRWWFTSTAFPLIAGTFGPISNLFSACALAQTWRVEFQLNDEGSETKGKRVTDPDWLIAINVVSLAFALAANVLLSLNFAQRVRYRVAAPLTVVFW